MKVLSLIILFSLSSVVARGQDDSIISFEWGCSTPFSVISTQAPSPIGTLCYDNFVTVIDAYIPPYLWDAVNVEWVTPSGSSITRCSDVVVGTHLDNTPVGNPFGTSGNIINDITGTIQSGSGNACEARNTTIIPEPIPTMGEWGLICLGLILLIFGVVGIKQRSVVIA